MGNTLAEVGVEMAKAAGAAVVIGGTWKLGKWAWTKIFGSDQLTAEDMKNAVKEGMAEALGSTNS
jgi:hypothetical protein